MFLPHAANLAAARPVAGVRSPSMIFVGAATPGRLAVAEAITAPAVFQGPGWRRLRGHRHEVSARRVAHRSVAGLYAGHLAALNMRNEINVLSGLNQRSFDPCLSATPVVSDAQQDLERCFEPGAEVTVWRDAVELNAIYDRFRRHPDEAAAIGEAGRRRVVADHGYGARLATLREALS
jgi:spore maturation protein CgeB